MWSHYSLWAQMCAGLLGVSTAFGAIPSANEDFSDQVVTFTPPHSAAVLTNLQLIVLSMLEDLEELLVDDVLPPASIYTDRLSQAALSLIDRYHTGEIDPTLSPSEAAWWALVAQDAEFAVGHPECELDPAVVIMLQDVLDALTSDLHGKAGGA